ncbi:sigma factor-like helix-turn-helix DNA-binding protein [Streptomyces sp. NPDC048389]|uniref:sigma factor-like helix-turn-helix DNA-binding protein n=1 Tax=Streptomyces sp. NPDC048389 TaxID=3154622 RepID=UPI003452D6F8
MSERNSAMDRRRAHEFDAFVAGAAGRLLHAATLLTAEPATANPQAQRLLTAALARTYADWDRLRGEDPYNLTRQELAVRFARSAWRHHRVFAHSTWRHQRVRGGVLDRLSPQERLVLVLRLHEGVAEEQTAAIIGLPADRVRAICNRAVATMRSAPRPRRRAVLRAAS